ncbi:MAG: MOSC domain-containing protein [Armatimonadota bacterium]
MQGKIVAISISERRGIPKTNMETARLVENHGIEGDAHAGDWHRQLSLLAVESIAKMQAKGADVSPGNFAENITTEGIDVPHLQIGDRLALGEAEVEITQIGKECHAHCQIYHQVGDCVMPREGVFARVIKGGELKVGDGVEIVSCEGSATPPSRA